MSAAIVLAVAAACITPWIVRNEVSIGCATLTTDGRALWKANNVNTYRTLADGKWIDDVFQPKSFPPSAQDQARIWHRRHVLVPVNECSQMHMFDHLTFTFWRNHPVEKIRLMGQATELLWDPRVHETQGRPGRGTWQDTARSVVEPVYVIPLYLVAAVGLFFVPAVFAWLAGLLLAYNTAAAMLFAGTTRYRIPYDFLLALLAGGAIERLLRSRSSGAATDRTAEDPAGPRAGDPLVFASHTRACRSRTVPLSAPDLSAVPSHRPGYVEPDGHRGRSGRRSRRIRGRFPG